MPTLDWIRETAEDRFWESQWDRQSQSSSHPIVTPVFSCSRCGIHCASPEELQRHFSLQHPLALPALYVQGRPAPRETVLRTPIHIHDVQLVHCSRCEVQVDGAPWRDLLPSDFFDAFVSSRGATWNIRLSHERMEDSTRSVVEYCVRFRIPDSADLNVVDAHFIKVLARNELSHADLEQFAAGLPVDAGAREYGGALGDYALGIVLKERRRFPYAPVDFGEFADRMRSALETLRHFRRPVALAVSSTIRFNLNDFHDDGTATATELESALQFFRPLISSNKTSDTVRRDAWLPQQGYARAICPLDQVTHQLLITCSQLANAGTLELADIMALRRLTEGSLPVSEHDLVKLRVICAEGLLRLGRATDALPLLHRLQFDPLFKGWAHYRLEEIAAHGR